MCKGLYLVLLLGTAIQKTEIQVVLNWCSKKKKKKAGNVGIGMVAIGVDVL